MQHMQRTRVIHWNLKDGGDLQRLQNAKIGEYFICPGKFAWAQLSCELLMYPNGFCQQEKGRCNLFLVVNHKPNHNGNARIKYKIKCNQLRIEWNDIARFDTPNHGNHQLVHKLNTKQLIQLNHVLFECTMDIISPTPHRHGFTRRFQPPPAAVTKQHNSVAIAKQSLPRNIRHSALCIPDNECNTNTSNIIWEFTHSDIQNLIKIPPSKFTTSPLFVQHDLTWILRCYPNGNAFHLGDFTVYLNIKHIPNQIYTLHAIISLLIPETNTKYYKQYTFNRNNNGMAPCDDGTLLIPSGYLPIQSLFTLDSLHIIITIDIRRITFTFQEQSMGKIRKSIGVKLTNIVSYEWKIPPQQCMEFKNSKMKQMWASDRFDCWYLVFAPNGHSIHNKGASILSLRCLELPSQFGAITVDISLKCAEYEWKHTAAFKFRPNGSESGWSSWPDDMMSFVEFCQMETVSFRCDIEIIAIYDRNGFELSKEQYKKSLITKTRARMDNQDARTEVTTMEEEDAKYETPGYVVQEEVKERDDDDHSGNMELKRRVMYLESRLNALEQVNKRNMCKHNGNDAETFEKWYRDKIQLPEYYHVFVNEGYDSLIAFCTLNDSELMELGVVKKGHRMRILKNIQQNQL